MDYSEQIAVRSATAAKWLCIPLLLLTSACDSPLISEAKRAENDREVISNELMLAMYPQSFPPGDPVYLERDFEAGADFICNEIKAKYHDDICSDPRINWRK